MFGPLDLRRNGAGNIGILGGKLRDVTVPKKGQHRNCGTAEANLTGNIGLDKSRDRYNLLISK